MNQNIINQYRSDMEIAIVTPLLSVPNRPTFGTRLYLLLDNPVNEYAGLIRSDIVKTLQSNFKNIEIKQVSIRNENDIIFISLRVLFTLYNEDIKFNYEISEEIMTEYLKELKDVLSSLAPSNGDTWVFDSTLGASGEWRNDTTVNSGASELYVMKQLKSDGNLLTKEDGTLTSATGGYTTIQSDGVNIYGTLGDGTVHKLSNKHDEYIIIEDQKPTGSSGGGPSGPGLRTQRDLTTIIRDDTGVVTLVANQFTLPIGNYIIEASCPAYYCDGHKTYISDITNSVLYEGESMYVRASTFVANRSKAIANVSLSSPAVFEILHYTETAGSASLTFGRRTGDTTKEVYTTVKITKIN